MAEIAQGSQAPKGGKVRVKRQSTRIDMTPMVDLAFLLLTFFILTTTFTRTPVIRLDLPAKGNGNAGPVVSEANVINVALTEGDRIYWWKGNESVAKITSFSSTGLRKILLEAKTNPHVMVLIKPGDVSRYQNMVDVLDEIAITGTSRFAIADLTATDKLIISRGATGN